MRHKKHIHRALNAHCSRPGCGGEGEYPAPKSKNELEARQYFCLVHIREFNKRWNFFDGMSREEIEHYHKDSVTGHRPTKPRIGTGYIDAELIWQKVNELRFGEGHQQKKRVQHPENEMEAMRVMELSYPIDWKSIKKRYKELAKRYHPDVAGVASEEKIKVINQAYSHLKRIYAL